MLPRRPATAFFFFLVGVAFSGYLSVSVVLGNMVNGMGDGTRGGRVALLATVLPFAAYFACGFFSAVARTFGKRRLAAVLAHLFPLLVFRDVHSFADIFKLVAILAFIYGIFAMAWIRMIFDEKHRLYQITERFLGIQVQG